MKTERRASGLKIVKEFMLEKIVYSRSSTIY